MSVKTLSRTLSEAKGPAKRLVVLDHFNVKIRFVLTVYSYLAGDPPKWTRDMELSNSVWEVAGKTVQLKCPASGNPIPSIRWLKDGQPFTQRPIGNVSKHTLILILHLFILFINIQLATMLEKCEFHQSVEIVN